MISDININILIPTDWQRFETISLEALKIMYNNPNFTKNGRIGQKQDGVDIYLQNNNEIIAAQCKLTFNVINEKIIREEVEKAKKFIPRISTLYICTTSPKDARLHEVIRCISLQENFKCYILFWEDIVQPIRSNENTFNMLFGKVVYDDNRARKLHDVSTLKTLFSNIDIDHVQKVLEDDLPEQVTPDFIYYSDAFDECWRACTIDFYDKSLKNVVDTFYTCWDELSLVICNAFQPINGGLIYGLCKNCCEHNYNSTVNEIDALRRCTYQALLKMVKYITEHYSCIDLCELNEIARRRRQHIINHIKGLY